MPAGFAFALKDKKVNWGYESEPEPFLNGRRLKCPRGRVLGGSSSINGSVYIRGNPQDYDHWAELGLPGWSYAESLPYFRRAEHREGGGDAYHGDSGPLRVSRPTRLQPLAEAWIEAGGQAGYGATNDLNGFRQEGLGPMDRTIHRGRRSSTATAYLRPAIERGNVDVATRALVTRILFEGRRAVGVEYLHRNRLVAARAENAVILSAGSINSPQLLMLSGVGNADELRRLQINVVQHLPGVGQNLQDHIEAHVVHACLQPVTIYPVLNSRLRRLAVGIQWAVAGTGPCASNQFEAGGFVRSRAGVPYPDLQFHFMAIAASYNGKLTFPGHCFQSHVGPLRPESRGAVTLRSGDPRESPRISFNYMTSEADRRDMRVGMRLLREIFAQEAFRSYRGRELAPGSDVVSDKEVDAYVREKAESGYHPSSSCKMGLDSDPMAVVDADGRVHGLEGLRIVDSSIMPVIASGNLNAPTIMIAEKLADRILGLRSLPPSNAPYYRSPDWQRSQR
jgi:choline dehydrogenase